MLRNDKVRLPFFVFWVYRRVKVKSFTDHNRHIGELSTLHLEFLAK